MMRKNWAVLVLSAIVSAVLLLGVAYATAAEQKHDKQEALTVGKKGEVTLSQETRVGDVVLKPGTYVLQHRVQGSDHFVHFVQMTGRKPATGEMKCQVEPMAAKTSRTAVYTEPEGGTQRIKRIEIRGENVAHVF